MKTLTIYEFEPKELPVGDVYDLSETKIKNCTGCWTCWWKTPGRCIYKDLDTYYHQYVNADRVIFFLKTKQGFVSSEVKSLLDRMIPLFLPYTNFHTGESMHDARYSKYPEIEVYYQDDFISNEEQDVFEKYIHRTFYHFHSKKTVVKRYTLDMEVIK